MRPYVKSLLFGVIIEVPLHEDDGRAFIAASRRKVAQRPDKVGQSSGGSPLRNHIPDQAVRTLIADTLADGFFQCVARQVFKVVVGKVL